MLNQRVLIVEDETMIAMLLEDVVAEGGYTVVGPLGRLAGALAAAASGEIDAALLDANLHGESVFPIARVLAERRIPFVFLTGYEVRNFPEEFRNERMLQKPFRSAQVLQVLQALLGHAAAAGCPLPRA